MGFAMPSRVTVQDVAKQANVDFNYVVKVMLRQEGVDRLIRNRILVAMEELDFPLRPNYNGVESRALGIIVPGVVNEYVDAAMEGVTEVTRAAGIGIKIVVPNADIQTDMPRFLSDPHIFGVLLLSPFYFVETIDICRHYEVPIATYSYRDALDDLSDVLLLQTNNQQSMVSAVDYLVELNHERIGFIAGYMEHNDARERLEGYQQSLAKHGIAYDESLVYYGDFLLDSGVEAGHALLQQDSPPSAIIGSSDMMAIGAINAAHSLSLKVPADCSVIGFDNVPLASHMTPALTTLAQPFSTLAAEAIEGLEKMARGEKLTSHKKRFKADFIIRKSTAARR